MSPVRLPDKTITAIGSGRKLNLQNFGVPTIFIFHFRDTADIARDLNNIVRDKYPLASDILIASVIDLHSIPKIGRGPTESMVKKEYNKAAGGLRDDQNPEDIIIILPDWNGQMTKALGFKDTNKQVGVAVLDSEGHVIGTYQGQDPEGEILTLVDQVMA